MMTTTMMMVIFAVYFLNLLLIRATHTRCGKSLDCCALESVYYQNGSVVRWAWTCRLGMFGFCWEQAVVGSSTCWNSESTGSTITRGRETDTRVRSVCYSVFHAHITSHSSPKVRNKLLSIFYAYSWCSAALYRGILTVLGVGRRFLAFPGTGTVCRLIISDYVGCHAAIFRRLLNTFLFGQWSYDAVCTVFNCSE